MANHKSAKKRNRTSIRRQEINTRAESKIKTYVKKVLAATEPVEGEKLYREAVAILDREAVSGKIHHNNASRKKSALTKHINGLKAAATTVTAAPVASKK